MRKYFALIALCCACLTAQRALATEAPTLANNPVLEQHVMEIAQELRCLVCQNETIAESHVLYKPRLSTKTFLLWIGPFVLLVLGFFVLWRTLRQRTAEADTSLSEQDVQRARELLGIPREKGQ